MSVKTKLPGKVPAVVIALEQAGDVKVDKGFTGKRARTWLSLTGKGRTAFERHLSALRSIANFDGSVAC